MTACRESLVFLKHAILALVFVLSTHALKREILKPSTVKVDFFMIGYQDDILYDRLLVLKCRSFTLWSASPAI